MNENRGALTTEIEAMGEQFFGKKLTKQELRLLPYIDYLSKNCKGIDPACVNDKERDILSEWKHKGFIDYSSSPSNGYVSIRRDFYDFMNNVLWIAYVDKC